MDTLTQKFIVSKLEPAVQKKIAARLAASLSQLGGESCATKTGYARNYLYGVASGIKRPSLGFATKCAKSLPDWNLDELVGASLASMGRKALTSRLAEEERGARTVKPPPKPELAVSKPTSAVVSPSEFAALCAELDAVRTENRKLKDYLIAKVVLA